MQGLASFAQSDVGRFYASSCERYGSDPAEGLSPILAANLRAALHVVSVRREREREQEMVEREANPDLARARDLEDWVRSHGG